MSTFRYYLVQILILLALLMVIGIPLGLWDGRKRKRKMEEAFAEPFAAPAGILPSAGRVQLSNYYFYRNLLIEVGILAPLLYLARGLYGGALGVRSRARVIVCLMIAGAFIAWSIGLKR